MTCFWPNPSAVCWWILSGGAWSQTTACIASWGCVGGFTVALANWDDIERMMREDNEQNNQ